MHAFWGKVTFYFNKLKEQMNTLCGQTAEHTMKCAGTYTEQQVVKVEDGGVQIPGAASPGLLNLLHLCQYFQHNYCSYPLR